MKQKSKHLKVLVLAVFFFPLFSAFAQEKNEGWTVFPAGQAEYSYRSNYPAFEIKCPDGWSYAQKDLHAISPDDPSRAVFTKDVTKNIPKYYNPAIFIALIPVKEPLTIESMSKAIKKNIPAGQTIIQEPIAKEAAQRTYVYCSSKNIEESTYTETYDFIGEGNVLIRVKVLCMMSDFEEIKDAIKKSISSIKFSTAPTLLDKP